MNQQPFFFKIINMYRMTLLVAVLMIGVSGHVMGRDDTRHQFQDNTPTPHPFHSNFTRGFLNGVAVCQEHLNHR